MSAPSDEINPPLDDGQSTDNLSKGADLRELSIDDVLPNDANPRLDFPQSELDRLATSIDQEGVLVPIVVYPKGEKYVLVDGERRYRCSLELGNETIPAVVTEERSEREILQQMFNIHLIREPWRDIPTAKALQRLADEIEKAEGRAADETELRDLTGLSLERVRQLMYVMTLPDEWQDHIRNGQIPLNFFWELKKNVIDALRNNRPNLLTEYGESNISEAFVKKRLDQVITDTVSLRKVSPIIKFAGQDAKVNDLEESAFDATIRNLIDQPDSTIEDAYEETVQTLVEVDKLSRRTASMVAAFDRLLSNTTDQEDRDTINRLGRDLIAKLSALLDADE